METPGFRFNPTEEQLLSYYLHHKICGNDGKVSAITEIDHICNYEPWELPMLAARRSKDTWHFFSRPDRKYRKSGNNNRVTKAGYWKVTGKKREIRNRENQVIGIKRILVFYGGRVRDPVWTNWTMHEYQLDNSYSNGRNYVISRLHKKKPKKTVSSAVDEVEPGHDSNFEVENPVTDITFPKNVTSPTAQQPEWHCSQGPSNVNLQHTNGVTNDYTMPLFEDVTSPTAQQPEWHCSQGPSNVYLQHTNGVTNDYTMPLFEIDSQFMGKFLNSNDQNVTSPSAQQPECRCCQSPSNVHLQHNNGVTDDYTMPYYEMDPRFMVEFLDSNEQDVTFPPTQQPELRCSHGPSNVYLQHTNGFTDDYTMSLSEIDPQFIIEVLDSNKQDVTFPTIQQPELHCSQGNSNVYLRHTNGITDDYTMPLSEVDPEFMVEFLDPNYQDVTSHTAQQPELHCSQGPSNVYLQHTKGVIDDYDYTMPLFEIDPQFMLEFLDSDKQDFTFPTTQQPELHGSQDPSNVCLQHANDLTDDYTMPSSQFGFAYRPDNNIEAVKLHPAIQDVQYHSGSMHAALDDSSPSESLVSLDIEDINDAELVKATVDRCLQEMHMMHGLSYENLQNTSNVVDECNLLSSQFVASGQQDKISEMVMSYPTNQDVHSYCGSMRISPSDSSPSESSICLHAKNISDIEAINNAALEGSSDLVWDRWFEHDSAYFSSTCSREK